MLVKPPLEELLPKVESRYTLAMLVAKRTRQLVDGAQPMVRDEGKNLVTVACEEVVEDKVVGIPGESRPIVPLRPEIEEARRLAREQAEAQAILDAFPEVNAPKAIEQKVEEEITIIDVFNLSASDETAEETSEESTNADDTSNADVNDKNEDTEEDVDNVTQEDIEDLKAMDGADEMEDKTE